MSVSVYQHQLHYSHTQVHNNVNEHEVKGAVDHVNRNEVFQTLNGITTNSTELSDETLEEVEI